MVDPSSGRHQAAARGRLQVRPVVVCAVIGVLVALSLAGVAALVTAPSDGAGGGRVATAPEDLRSVPASATTHREAVGAAGDRVVRPNIVVVYLDDMRASDLHAMPNVRRGIADRGVTFTNAMVSTAACCPARATHLSGRYAHNTGVLHNSPPHGGYGVYKHGQQATGETLPVWLQQVGYRSIFFGKYLNHYPDRTDPGEVPPGFSDWYGLYEGAFDGGRYSIYRQTRYAVRVRPREHGQPLLDPAQAHTVAPAPGGADGQVFVYRGEDRHQTEVLMDGAVKAIDRDDGAEPLYLNVWLTAPHTGGDAPVVGGGRYATRGREFTVRPAEPELRELQRRLRRDEGLGDLRLRRPGAFNERDVSDKPPVVRATPRLDRRAVRDIEIRNALRLAALKSVDRRMADLLAAVDRAQRRTGRPTYVVFSSDNGYFLGEHRLPYEKNWHYGATSDVPLLVRGPGVTPGVEIAVPVGNVDLAPTLLAMAGPGTPAVGAQLDGRSVLPLLQRSRTAQRNLSWGRRAMLLEGFWGRTDLLRYAGVRTRRHVYVEHHGKGGDRRPAFRELYDVVEDPGYERNLLHPTPTRRARHTAERMQQTLRQLRTCAAHECRTSPPPPR
ncbi:MAG TPA: sulfatase-like hydrolase/transferase [Euzebyales bacterium]|nr:sulfatase-like hydrolase/transferase [Euzebyales bacterium]